MLDIIVSKEGWILRFVLAAIVLMPLAHPVFAQTTQAPPSPAPQTQVDASRGGITISSGVNSLTIGARAQVRWTLEQREEADSDTIGPGVGRKDGAISAFDVPRLRLTMSGGVFKPWMRYSFQFELSRAPGESGSRIKDAILEIRPVGRNYRVQFGQFKAPFGLQQLTSSGRLQFVERAITDAKFNPTREMGAMFGGTLANRKFGYDLGIFNGSGESLRQNNRSHLWVARVFVNPFGAYALSESAVDATDKPILHLGAGVRGGKQIRGRTTTGVFDNADDQKAYNVEFAFRHRRYYYTGEYFWMTDEQRVPTTGQDIDSRGYHLQGGFMAVPKRVELGVLIAGIDGNADVDDAAVTEVRGVFGYYFQGHNLKLQADAGQVGYGARYATLSSRARQGLPSLGTRLVSGRGLADTQVRVQLQLAF